MMYQCNGMVCVCQRDVRSAGQCVCSYNRLTGLSTMCRRYDDNGNDGNDESTVRQDGQRCGRAICQDDISMGQVRMMTCGLCDDDGVCVCRAG